MSLLLTIGLAWAQDTDLPPSPAPAPAVDPAAEVAEPTPVPDPATATEPLPVPEPPTPEPAPLPPPEPAPLPLPLPVPAPAPVPAQVPVPAPAPGVDTLFGFWPPTPALPDADARDVIVVSHEGESAPSFVQQLVPPAPERGLGRAFGLTVLAGLFFGGANLIRRLAGDMRSSGLIPWFLRVLEVLVRVGVAALALAAVAAVTPASIAPALPIVIMAGAVAVGWSTREMLHDLVAGLFILVEGQFRAGHFIRGQHHAGTVEAIGLRVTWLRDVYGQRVVVPNRVLLAQPLVTDENPWPRLQFTVAMPQDASTAAVRAALEETIVLSPWVAPDPASEVHPDALIAHHWHVTVRVIDGQYAERFQGLLRERVEEILAS